MLQFLTSNNANYVGLDISSTTVKLIELSRSGGQYKVESFSVVPLPEGAVVEKNIQDEDAVIEAVSQLVSKAKTSNKTVASSVSGSAVISKVIEVDADLSEDELDDQIRMQADQYIPYALDEVSLDHEVIGPSETDPSKNNVLLVACRNEHTDARTTILESANLTAEVVDVEVYAMERAYTLFNDAIEGGEDKVVAIVDIGSTMVTLYVLDAGKTVYSREQLFGGKQLTEAIQHRYGFSYEEAGQRKKQGGLPEDYETEVLEPFKDAICQQISRSLQFFYSSTSYTEVHHILLAGGTCSIEGLPSLVEEQIGIPATLVNPFEDMKMGSKVNESALMSDAPSLMVATGLALRSFEGSVSNINLLPWREKLRLRLNIQFGIITGVFAALGAVLAAAGYLYMASQNNLQKERIAEVKKRIAQKDEQIKQIEHLKDKEERLLEKMRIISDLQGKRPVIVKVFDEFVKTLPDGVMFNNIKVSGEKYSIVGISESSSKITTLMRNIKRSDLFNEPKLRKQTQANAGKTKTLGAYWKDIEEPYLFELDVTLKKVKLEEE